MEIKLKKNLNTSFYKTVGYSWISPIIGSVFILPWGFAIFTIILNKMPIFIFIINILIWPIFMIILLKQVRQVIGSKFLVAFKESHIVFSLNHGIKNVDEEKDYFIDIDLSRDVIQTIVVKETKTIPFRKHGKSGTSVKQSTFIEFHLKERFSKELEISMENVLNDTGFQGTPVILKDDSILQLYLDGNTSKLKEIQKHLIRSGTYNGRIVTRKIRLDDNMSKEEILDELTKIKKLGDSILARGFLTNLQKSGNISKEQLDKLSETLSK